MKYFITLFIAVLVLTGCTVEEPHHEAYASVSKTCQEQGKVMYVERYSNRTVIKCIDP